jgi:large subunit ribosomal protein L19
MANTKGQALIADITKEYIKERPEFKAGDTVKVYVKIKEGNKERIQLFEGLVIKRQGGGILERTFPVHSPMIDRLEVARVGVVRRAKLNYIRSLSKKASRIKEQRNNQ